MRLWFPWGSAARQEESVLAETHIRFGCDLFVLSVRCAGFSRLCSRRLPPSACERTCECMCGFSTSHMQIAYSIFGPDRICDNPQAGVQQSSGWGHVDCLLMRADGEARFVGPREGLVPDGHANRLCSSQATRTACPTASRWTEPAAWTVVQP